MKLSAKLRNQMRLVEAEQLEAQTWRQLQRTPNEQTRTAWIVAHACWELALQDVGHWPAGSWEPAPGPALDFSQAQATAPVQE